MLFCWSLDLGSTPDGSLSFSFPLDYLGLCMLTSKLDIVFVVLHTQVLHNQLECSDATSRFLVDKLNQTEAMVR